MIKAVIFDLDGTLLDTLGDIAAAHNTGLRELGFPERELSEFNHVIGSGIKEAIKKAAPSGADDESLQKLLEMYQVNYPARATRLTRSYEGMTEALNTLAASDKMLAVFTNKTEPIAIKLVRHYFPGIDFKFVWGNDGVRPLKPNAEAGKAACGVLGLDPGEIAYVGDSDVDILFAFASGFLPVGACWGYRGRQELENTGAKKLAEKPLDIPELL